MNIGGRDSGTIGICCKKMNQQPVRILQYFRFMGSKLLITKRHMTDQSICYIGIFYRDTSYEEAGDCESYIRLTDWIIKQ